MICIEDACTFVHVVLVIQCVCNETSDGAGSICSFIRVVKQEQVKHQQWEQRGLSRDVVRETGRMVRAGGGYQKIVERGGVVTRKHTMDKKTLRGDSRGKSRLRTG